jgi:hypothetical protein
VTRSMVRGLPLDGPGLHGPLNNCRRPRATLATLPASFIACRCAPRCRCCVAATWVTVRVGRGVMVGNGSASLPRILLRLLDRLLHMGHLC